MRTLLLFLAALSVAAAAQDAPRRHGCGTSRQLERIEASPIGVSARTAAGGTLAGRVLTTAHFAIHYTLGRNLHRPAWDTSDASLKARHDSLYLVHQAASPAARRDSLMNANLDALGAPHPAFVTAAAAYLENAWSYYGDTLGMRMPDSNQTDFFRRWISGKFNVEIADIDNLQNYDGTYGLTFLPEGPYSATMLLDNDFLYNASVNLANGAVSGTPLVNAATSINYNTEWDKGLAVTIAHEFYHAVQFEYATSATAGGRFHSWYELGAVGMEERLAPAVNDYRGYLKDVLSVKQVSLLTTGGSNANYGNGIFHIFLYHALGKAFDVPIWEALRVNGNNLPAALVTGVGSQARWDSLYAAYAAAVSIAGRPGAGASSLAFSPDMAVWPKPVFDSAVSTATSLSLSPLTYRLVAPVSSGATQASYTGIAGSWRVSQSGTAFSSQYLAHSPVPLVPNGAIALAVANASASQTATLSLARAASPAGISAFPNPARDSGSIHFYSSASGSSASLYIVSESGRRVALLAPEPGGSFWTWSFRDGQNRKLPPGVYHYGLSGETPRTLVVLP
ncbi:MAG: hypothetical protein K0Q91_1756 [Fibrobacteria bacterium]|jgi:hypothetical protein|nr:hypothetical protein [Fibrobacteria bacterium]